MFWENVGSWLSRNRKELLVFLLFLTVLILLSALRRALARVLYTAKLRRLCRRKQIPFSLLRSPVCSLYGGKACADLALTLDGERYEVAFFPGKTVNRSLLFCDGKCIAEHVKRLYLQNVNAPGNVIGGNLRVPLSLSEKAVDYRFPAEGKRMLLIHPDPAEIAAVFANRLLPADSSSVLDDGTVLYTAKGLLARLEREKERSLNACRHTD